MYVWTMRYKLEKTGSHSIKYPNFWISVPTQSWSKVLLVVLQRSEFPKANATIQITLVCLVIVLCLLEWTRLACWGNFSVIENGWFSLAACLCVILFQIIEKFQETFKMLNTSVWGRSNEWNTNPCSGTSIFKEGQTSTEDNEHSGQPSTSTNEENIQKVWKVICSNCRLTAHEVAETDGISKTKWDEILTKNLAMYCFVFNLVPCLLSKDQKKNRVDVSKDLVNCANAYENLKTTSS